MRALAPALPDRIPAASSGTMNNLTIGGIDPRPGPQFAQPYTYYETIAGGHGASPQSSGASGHHAHMTNSLNTPVEALEYAYPFRMVRYALRRNSGGEGKHRGGDGLIREIELLGDAQVTLLADRRITAPSGLAGGKSGASGKTSMIDNGKKQVLPGKCTREVKSGTRIPRRGWLGELLAGSL
jgi:N-methylhydantoinase B